MLKPNNFLKHFLPFTVLVVGAFFGLAEFRKLNYSYKRNDQTVMFREYLKEAGMSEDDYQMKTTISLEDEYEKTIKKIDLDNWENIRGPRPGEDSKEIQKQQRKLTNEK